MNRNLQRNQFGVNETHLSAYGIEPVPVDTEQNLRKYHRFDSLSETRRLSGPQLRGGQTWVDTNRVSDIARNGLNDPEEADSANPIGIELPNRQVLLMDGHHRAAASALNGGSMLVHIMGRYGAPHDPRVKAM